MGLEQATAVSLHSLTVRIMAKLSKYFRGHPITSTRPGFGLVATLGGPGLDFILRVRDAFIAENRLVLKTLDSDMHITLTQTTLFIDEDRYDPATLPHDLLPRMLEVAKRAASTSISSLSSCGDFICTGRLIVLGRECPSHIAVEVKPVDPVALRAFRTNVASALREAMIREAQESPNGVLKYDEANCSLVGPGWRLSDRGYLERSDYRTHVTLGVMRTGKDSLDRIIGDSLEEVVAAQQAHYDTSGEDPNVFHGVCGGCENDDDNERKRKMDKRREYYEKYRTALAAMVSHRKKHCPFAAHPSVLAAMDNEEDPVAPINAWNRLVTETLNDIMKPFIVNSAVAAISQGNNNPPSYEEATRRSDAGPEDNVDNTGLIINVLEITGDVVDLSNVNLRSV